MPDRCAVLSPGKSRSLPAAAKATRQLISGMAPLALQGAKEDVNYDYYFISRCCVRGASADVRSLPQAGHQPD